MFPEAKVRTGKRNDDLFHFFVPLYIRHKIQTQREEVKKMTNHRQYARLFMILLLLTVLLLSSIMRKFVSIPWS